MFSYFSDRQADVYVELRLEFFTRIRFGFSKNIIKLPKDLTDPVIYQFQELREKLLQDMQRLNTECINNTLRMQNTDMYIVATIFEEFKSYMVI